MSSHAHEAPNPATRLDPVNVNVRIKISALWTAMLFVFAYVDIFSLYRPDFRADIEAGQVSGFTVNQPFLVATTIYVAIPSLMLFGVLVLPAMIARIATLVLSGLYALTIIGGAIGEWSYYVVGSALEVALLAAVGYYAWTWPVLAQPASEPMSGNTDEASFPGADTAPVQAFLPALGTKGDSAHVQHAGDPCPEAEGLVRTGAVRPYPREHQGSPR